MRKWRIICLTELNKQKYKTFTLRIYDKVDRCTTINVRRNKPNINKTDFANFLTSPLLLQNICLSQSAPL